LKSHDVAKALAELTQILKASPNSEIGKLQLTEPVKNKMGSSQIAVSLDILISLATIDKSEWLNFASEMSLPMEFRPRDGSRDILGKIFRYLEENQEAREKIKAKVRQKSSIEGSDSVIKALSLLIPNKPRK
jgi:hypothetical protein